MSMTDPVADFLTRIRNGIQAAHETVDIPASNLKTEMARILKEQGYINAYEALPPDNEAPGARIRVTLKYTEDRRSAISGLKRVSRPGLRVYSKADGVPRVLGGMGISILSTNLGLLTDREARERKVGGEVLCQVW